MATADRPPAAQFRTDEQRLRQLNGQPLTDDGLLLCCRLVMRYENTGAGSQELARLAQDQLEAWGLERRRAFQAARQLWNSGYRPALDTAPVGSGADVAAAA